MTSASLPYPSEIARELVKTLPPESNLWLMHDESAIDSLYEKLCEQVMRTTNSLSQIESASCGSGYASLVDAWFYNRTPDFAPAQPICGGETFVGLAVLLCRLAQCFVFMQGTKHWHSKGGSGYFPSFEAIDDLTSPGVIALSAQVQPILEQAGLRRLPKRGLAAFLSPDIEVATNLSDPP